jgi:toxin ParE1/3/4
MATVYYRPAARRDLIEHFVYLASNAAEATAERFIANAETSFTALSERPNMGSPLTPRNQQLAGLRKWRVTDFENFLIFYLPRPNGVSIVRVLYAARDWWDLLGIDP